LLFFEEKVEKKKRERKQENVWNSRQIAVKCFLISVRSVSFVQSQKIVEVKSADEEKQVKKQVKRKKGRMGEGTEAKGPQKTTTEEKASHK